MSTVRARTWSTSPCPAGPRVTGSRRDRSADHPGDDRHREPLRRLHHSDHAPVPGHALRPELHGCACELERESPVRRDAEHGLHQQLPAHYRARSRRSSSTGTTCAPIRAAASSRRRRAPRRTASSSSSGARPTANRAGNATSRRSSPKGSDVSACATARTRTTDCSETVGLQDSHTRADQYFCNSADCNNP